MLHGCFPHKGLVQQFDIEIEFQVSNHRAPNKHVSFYRFSIEEFCLDFWGLIKVLLRYHFNLEVTTCWRSQKVACELQYPQQNVDPPEFAILLEGGPGAEMVMGLGGSNSINSWPDIPDVLWPPALHDHDLRISSQNWIMHLFKLQNVIIFHGGKMKRKITWSNLRWNPVHEASQAVQICSVVLAKPMHILNGIIPGLLTTSPKCHLQNDQSWRRISVSVPQRQKRCKPSQFRTLSYSYKLRHSFPFQKLRCVQILGHKQFCSWVATASVTMGSSVRLWSWCHTLSLAATGQPLRMGEVSASRVWKDSVVRLDWDDWVQK